MFPSLFFTSTDLADYTGIICSAVFIIYR